MTEVDVQHVRTVARARGAMQRAEEILSAVGECLLGNLFGGPGDPLPDEVVIECSEEEAAEFRYLQKALVALADELKGLY